MIVGKIIKDLRERRNYSQKEMAKMLHTTPGCISKYETGRIRPPLEVIIQIADMLNVSVDYLIGRNSVELDYKRLKERYCRDKNCFELIDEALSLDQNNRKLLIDILEVLRCHSEMHRITRKK